MGFHSIHLPHFKVDFMKSNKILLTSTETLIGFHSDSFQASTADFITDFTMNAIYGFHCRFHYRFYSSCHYGFHCKFHVKSTSISLLIS